MTARRRFAVWIGTGAFLVLGGHGDGDHAHEDGETHEHATGPGLCGTRCPSHFTQKRLDRLECDREWEPAQPGRCQ
jgi:hypothetical protein